jgi:hypothetical protein
MKHFFGIIILTFLVFGIAGSALAMPQGTPHTVGGDAGGTVGGDRGGTVQPTPIIIENPIKAKSITELFEAIIDIMLVFAIPLIAFFIIYAGFMYVTSRGNEEAIRTAHMALLYALIGGVLILGAKVLISVIGGTVDDIRNAALIINSLLA